MAITGHSRRPSIRIYYLSVFSLSLSLTRRMQPDSLGNLRLNYFTHDPETENHLSLDATSHARTTHETSEARKFFGALYHVGGAARLSWPISAQIWLFANLCAPETENLLKKAFRLGHAYRQFHIASFA